MATAIWPIMRKVVVPQMEKRSLNWRAMQVNATSSEDEEKFNWWTRPSRPMWRARIGRERFDVGHRLTEAISVLGGRPAKAFQGCLSVLEWCHRKARKERTASGSVGEKPGHPEDGKQLLVRGRHNHIPILVLLCPDLSCTRMGYCPQQETRIRIRP